MGVMPAVEWSWIFSAVTRISTDTIQISRREAELEWRYFQAVAWEQDLNQIIRIGRLHIIPAKPRHQQRAVESKHPPPRLGIAPELQPVHQSERGVFHHSARNSPERAVVRMTRNIIGEPVPPHNGVIVHASGRQSRPPPAPRKSSPDIWQQTGSSIVPTLSDTHTQFGRLVL